MNTMSTTIHQTAAAPSAVRTVERLGPLALPIGLATVVAAIGGMKFTAYEAEGISGLVSNHPLMSWVYQIMSVRAFGTLLGVVELGIALLLILGIARPRLGVIGAGLAAGMFATTLSFMLTTPGVFEASLGGFPALSIMPGQFLVKDIALLAIALRLLSDGLAADRQARGA